MTPMAAHNPLAMSPLALALEAKANERHIEPVPELASIFDMRGQAFEGGVRVMVKQEEDDAVEEARTYVKGKCGADGLTDDDIMRDAKNISALFRACRQPDGTELFPGPEWIRRHVTSDQIATLMRAYNINRAKRGGANWGIDDERIEAIYLACVRAKATDIPEMVLATIPNEALANVVVLLSIKLEAARLAAEEATDKLEAAYSLVDANPGVSGQDLRTGIENATANNHPRAFERRDETEPEDEHTE